MGPYCCRKSTPAHQCSLPVPGGGTLWVGIRQLSMRASLILSEVYSPVTCPINHSCTRLMHRNFGTIPPSWRPWMMGVRSQYGNVPDSQALHWWPQSQRGTGSVTKFMCWFMGLRVLTVWLKLVVLNVCTHRDRQTHTHTHTHTPKSWWMLIFRQQKLTPNKDRPEGLLYLPKQCINPKLVHWSISQKFQRENSATGTTCMLAVTRSTLLFGLEIISLCKNIIQFTPSPKNGFRKRAPSGTPAANRERYDKWKKSKKTIKGKLDFYYCNDEDKAELFQQVKLIKTCMRDGNPNTITTFDMLFRVMHFYINMNCREDSDDTPQGVRIFCWCRM